ncbi:phytanoyl-CoA dioxygenase PhyH [Dongia mobilis]|uniref:Phytanoyl-CoA dioxygenase PhyH n=1 Tax=Dongia mobilis TaxID=578943 RepID=A0A4R6WMP8_9PROT|nr:phytanoyl-CoA dioxygenase family protein [Dongia mobilis]TDQ82262.1 phytanoyl-CoA dioxygenase PhyH [Dongia mobilis]
MYTKRALFELGVTGADFTQSERERLDRDGFFVRPGYFSTADCAEMAAEFDRLSALEGDRGGHEVHVEPGAPRVSNIFNKSSAFDRCLEARPVLAAAHYLLGEIKVHGANLREPARGQGHQDLHVDVPKHFPEDWWVLNVIITFDDMRRDNGPTRVVPGSHHWPPLNVAAVNRFDWSPDSLSEAEKAMLPDDLATSFPGEVLVEAPKGSLIICNSAIWHGGTRNLSGDRRRVLHLTYTRRDLPQQLVQRQYLTEATYNRLGPVHRYLLDIEPLPDGAAILQSARAPGTTNDWWR